MAEQEIIIKEKALEQMEAIRDYIISEGYPHNAKKFIQRMSSYIYSINISPFVHSLCRYKKFKRYIWHCAVFANNT